MFLKFISKITALLLSIAAVLGLGNQGHKLNPTFLQKNISASTEKRISSGVLTGAHIIVSQKSEVIFNETFGKNNAGGENLQKDALYRIASMTKPVTAVALLIEYERGTIDIYADISDYLEGYENMLTVTGKKCINSIKVFDLVTHTSGIASGDAAKYYNETPPDKRTPRSVTEYLCDKPLGFDPGTSQEYNTVSFDIAARIIEIVTGLEFEEYLKKNIFDKLGMTDTTFEPTAAQWSRMVAMHNYENGKAVDNPVFENCVFGNFPVSYHCAGAGLISSADDYLRFAEMLQNGGVGLNGQRILKEESVKLMATPFVSEKIMSGDWNWGLGVRVITGKSNILPVGSFGWSGAFGTHFWVDPVNKITAVYMKNSAFDGGAGSATGNEFEKDVMNSLSLKKLK